MIQSFLCIPHIPVGYAGGTTPRMGEVELRLEQQSRAMQDRKMLLHFLHSLRPCNLAIAETMQDRKMLLGSCCSCAALLQAFHGLMHKLHSLHPCNLAITEDTKK